MKKTAMFGLLAAVLAFGFVLAGCEMESTGGGGGGDLGVGGLGPIGEPTTGRETVKESGVLLEPFYMSGMTMADVAQLNGVEESYPQQDGVTSWSVTNGRMSFILETPQTLEQQYLLIPFYDFGHGDEWKVTVKGNVKGMLVSYFYIENNDKNYLIVRGKAEATGKTVRSSQILYIYVDDNTTLERGKVKGLPDELGENAGQLGILTFNAFKLELKKGWNLVQFDSAQTFDSNIENIITTAKIATKNVPWSVSYGYGTKNKGFWGTLR